MSWGIQPVFMNPPFSRKLKKPIDPWLAKAVDASKITTVYGLIPSRTDTKWFHRYIHGVAAEVRFIPHRVAFLLNGKKMVGAGFPSIVVVWRPLGRWKRRQTVYGVWDYR